MDNQPSWEPDHPKARVYHIPDTLTNWPWPARMSPHIDKVNADFNASFKGYPQLEAKAAKVIEQGETGGHLPDEHLLNTS